MAGIKTVIFDFDGVIADSVDIKTRAFAYLFKEYPQSVRDEVVKYHLENGGKSRYVKFKYYYENILKKEYTDETGEKLAAEFSEFVFEEVVRCPYIKGAIEFIENNHENYYFFIVSGTPDGEIKAIAEKRGISKYFKEVLGTPAKKDEWVRYILHKYNLLPDETVFIGDAYDDYKGASENGCRFIGVNSGGHNPFEKLKVDLLVGDLGDIHEKIRIL